MNRCAKRLRKRMQSGSVIFLLLLLLLPIRVWAAEAPPSGIDKCQSNFGYDFKMTFSDVAWASKITKVTVNGIEYGKGTSSYSVYNNKSWYAGDNYSNGWDVYIGEGWDSGDEAECVISADGYSDLTLLLNRGDHSASVKTEDEHRPLTFTLRQTQDGEDAETVVLANATVEQAYEQSLYYELGGSNKDTAMLEFAFVPENSGLTAEASDGVITVSGTPASAGAIEITVTASAEGDDSVARKITFTVEEEQEETKKAAPKVTGSKVKEGFSTYLVLQIDGEDAGDYMDKLNALSVNESEWTEASSKISLYGMKGYYPDKENNRIYLDEVDAKKLISGDQITIQSEGYEDLLLTVTANADDTFSVTDDPNEDVTVDVLHVRLVGAFEAALIGQKDYDAISGASTSVTANKNSDVTVQGAVLPEGQEPAEDDWVDFKELGIRIDSKRTAVSIDSNNSGMVAVYSVYDSSLTLQGTPYRAGEYPVSVTITDEYGRTAVSNALIFRVYEGNEKLIDCLTLEHSQKMADGKYIYNMEPWAIAAFGGTDETVTVPADIKAWYGSHTSGTYGELGYAVDGAPTQTLIAPSGCNLTLVNMKILSSVKIVVEDGGRLVLLDSSVHGQVEVRDGGAFSMNYDDHSGEFLTGASMNGQLILQDGATLEHASIYSNTNYLTNGSEARQNVEPVVVVNGNVNVKGQVFIRGDEAPTGTDPDTGKSYSGQPALKVENGILNIEKDSVLAVYGGGISSLTSVGGDALILDNGTIAGEGKLIAVAGNGDGDNGGTAVSGKGTVSVNEAYLEGGSTYLPKPGSVPGTALGNTVTLASSTNRNIVDGAVRGSGDLVVSETQWIDITTVPDLSLYPVEPGGTPEEPGDDPEKDPVTPGTDPENQPETKPGTDPENQPGTKPGTDTEEQPETKPGTDTEEQPGTKPGTDAGNQSGTTPGTDAAEKPGNQPDGSDGNVQDGNGSGDHSGSGHKSHKSHSSSDTASATEASVQTVVTAAQTGDETPIMLYVVLLMASAGTVGMLTRKKQ